MLRVKILDALLVGLSNVFDCLDYEILIAKFNVLSLTALKLIHDYLLHKKQGTKNSTSYSDWLEIVFGAHQGSLLGPLLFNIFLEHLFFIMKNIASYADDNTPYISGKTLIN